MPRTASLILLALFLAEAPVAKATILGMYPNLIVNGSFEQSTGGEPDLWGSAGNLSVTGSQGTTDGNLAVAFSFGNVASNGFITQSFATDPGQEYSLTFDFGKYSVNQPDQVARLEVDLFGVLPASAPAIPFFTTTVEDNTPGPGNSPATSEVYDSYAFTFVAPDTSTTLQFTDRSDPQAPGGGFDAMLDNVSVVATPEPASLGLLALGLLGAAAARRR